MRTVMALLLGVAACGGEPGRQPAVVEDDASSLCCVPVAGFVCLPAEFCP
jgi:hypothetical protein